MPKPKEQKRREAAERQARYDALTLNEKLVRATNPHRRGDSTRERGRLFAARMDGAA